MRFLSVVTLDAKSGDLIVVNRNGKLVIVDQKGRERERYALAYGSRLHVRDGQEVEAGAMLVEWDPFTSSILSEIGGKVEYQDIVECEHVREEAHAGFGLRGRRRREGGRGRENPDISHSFTGSGTATRRAVTSAGRRESVRSASSAISEVSAVARSAPSSNRSTT